VPPVVREPKRALILLLIVIVSLLAAACDDQPAPTSPVLARRLIEATRTAGSATASQAAASSEAGHTGSVLRFPQLGDNPLNFERFSIEQGLSQSVVSSILQDSRSFMWFGTQDGLNRFDGYEFVVYKHDPENPNSLGGNFVQALHEDASGTLWVGTNGGGISKLDRETGHFVHLRHDPGDPNSLSNNIVLALYEDREGMLWIGTSGGGLDRLDPDTGEFVHHRNDPDDPHSLSHNVVQSIIEDREGVLWIGMDGGGLDRFDRGTGQFVHYQNDPTDPHSLSHNAVLSICEDRQSVLWIGTNGGGLDRLDRETGRFVHFQNDPDDPHSLSNDQVWSVYEDQEGVLWIGTFGGGLDRLDRETGRFVHSPNDPRDPSSLSNNQIWSIYQDRVGMLWIGTFGGGVNRLEREKKFELTQADPDDANSLSENVVWAIYEEREGPLWIGTNGGGLNRLDRETGRFIHFRNVPTDTSSLSDDVVWSIHQDGEGTLWVGTSAGLDRLVREDRSAPGVGKFDHFPSMPVFTIYEDRAGTLWIGTWGGGLGTLDRETGKLTFYQNDPADAHSLSDSAVLSVFEDADGVLWVGTFNGGLNRFNRDLEQFVHYQNNPDDPQSLSHNTVLAIHEDRQGMFWLATGGGGLNWFDRETGTFGRYTEKEGLPNDTVYGILEDDVPPEGGGPNLWLSTNRGLSRFNPQTETFRNYDVGDGLQSSEFNQGSFHKSYSGEMFFGGVNGFNAFFPEQVRDNPYIPPVVLTALTQGGEGVAAGKAVESLSEVRFDWPRNFFEFEFAALSFARPEKNRYAYLLEGFDTEWVEAGTRRFGRYTNLPGGTYTLRLKGSNNDGIWNEEGYSLKVTVVPPFWRTWWFLGTVSLALLAGAIGAYGLRVRSIEARSRELEAQVALRTKELAALNAVSAAVNRSLDLQRVLDSALDMTLQITETEGGGVYLLDENSGILSIATHRGFSPEYVRQIDGLQVGEGFSGYVAQSGQTLVVKDVATDERLARMAARETGFHSMVCVPLCSKGKVMGTLFAVTQTLREFTDQDVQLLTSISQQIGVALENAQLFRAEQRRAEQFRLISEVGHYIITILDVQQLLDELALRTNEILGYYQVGIGLIEGDQVVIKTGVGPYWENNDHEPIRLRVGHKSLVGSAAASGEAMLAPDVSQDSHYYRLPEILETRSELAVPMRTRQRVIGVVDVQSRRLAAFDESDVVVLQSLADQAAVAIEKAQLLEAERQRADELDALRTTMTDITAELELSALLQAIVERAAGLLDATGGELGLFDEATQELRIVVSHNLGQDYVGTRHQLGEGAMGRVAETGESLIIEDYQAWVGGLAEYSHVHATLAAPLKVGGRLVGVFTTVTTDSGRQFTPADLHLLDLFTQQAAIAIENARLYEQAQQLAVMEERQRLARDLHDSVTQALYGMTLYSEAAAEELSLRRFDIVAEYLRDLQGTAKEALAEMRLLIYELRPSVLAEEGLEAALQARLLSVEGRAGLKTGLRVEVEDALPPEVEDGLYRIAREALNNALRHAQASNITIVVRNTSQEEVALEVIDDGIGFDPASVREKGGLGLPAMEERVARLGGRLTVGRGPQGGTCVLVEVPV